MNGFSRQRGAIGLLAILTLLLAILFTAVAVDTGRLMLIQRQLQTVADMAALDASHVTGHCSATENNLADIALVANATADRNGYSGQPLVVQLGVLTTDAQGIRQFETEPDDVATAVKVVASKSVPASLFAGGIWGHQVNLQAEAVAERQAIAGFSAGTTLASLSAEDGALLNALLGSILGSPVNLNVLSYEGIADTRLSLADLLEVSAGIGTLDELLHTNLSVAQVLNLYTDAISVANTVSVDVLTGMSSLVAANVNPLSVMLADVINVTTQTPENAAKASISLLDLLTTTLLVANGSNAVTLPLNVSLPAGLLAVSTQLQIIEPPQIAIGPPGKNDSGNWRTTLKTAQVRLNTGIQSNINLNIAGLVGAKATVDLGLQVHVAQGEAWLKSIECSTIQHAESIVRIDAEPGVASVNLTKASTPGVGDAAIEVSAVVLFISVPIAEVGIGLTLPLQNNAVSELTYQLEQGDSTNLPQTQRADTAVGASLGNLANSLDLDVTLLGVINLPLLDQLIADAILSQILAPVLGALGATVIDPLLRVLGIEMGIIDVKLFSIDIDRPELKR